MNIQEIFLEATDGLELSGLLYIPEQETKKIVINVHGMASNCMKRRDYVLAETMTNSHIAYFSFNNRGHDLISYSRKFISGKKKTVLMGTSYEEVLECEADIKGAIQKVLELGYTDIYLQGHSLGCTKIVYTYQQLIKEQNTEYLCHIKAVLLLSLIDIQGTQKHVLKDKYEEMLQIAEQKSKEGKNTELMPNHAFIWPISVQTYLRYFKDNALIHVARYGEEEYDFPELNQIQVPLFMCWGNDNELILQPAEALVELMQNKIQQKNKKIRYIDGAGHNYRQKEEELAKQIQEFIQKYQ